MKKVATKKVTINDLAKMVVEGRKETKDLSNTIDNLAIMVARGFDGVNSELGEFKKEVSKRFDEAEKDIIEVKENLAGTRRDVLSMGDKFTLKYELHDIASRVSVLEQKQKVKR